MIFALLTACSIAYHALSIIALLRFRRRARVPACLEPVSILKPVRGRDVGFREAIRSHALLDYPAGYELLFGVSDPNDPAAADIRSLQQEFPGLAIRLLDTKNDAPNGKAGSLRILASEAKYPIVLLNDSDIHVEPDYLSRVVSLLSGNIGLVTCLYRGTGSSWPARFEAIGISTEFAPSVLVAEMLSASHFAFGSTVALRRTDLDAFGGFAAVQNYLADDYQLGECVHKLGKSVAIADTVVETSMGKGSWTDVWKHQIRWSRTIRVSNAGGYAGYLITQLTFWCLLCAIAGYWRVALFGFAMRIVSAAASLTKMSDKAAARLGWLVPARDLFGTAVWFGAMFGNTVEWRGLRFRLHKNGTIQRIE